MKKIVFGFSRPISLKFKPYALAIMLFDNIDYDHAYTKFVSNDWETSFIYQSSGSRTNFMSQQYFDSINLEIEEYELECDNETFNKIGKICTAREGVSYPIKQTLGKGLVCIVKALFRFDIKNPWEDPNRQDCIEEQAAILSEGLGITTKLDMGSVSVRPYRDWIAGLPQLKRVK